MEPFGRSLWEVGLEVESGGAASKKKHGGQIEQQYQGKLDEGGFGRAVDGSSEEGRVSMSKSLAQGQAAVM